MSDIQVLIFSKDRPLQLDGTLRSFARHCRDAGTIVVRVLYTASTSRNRSLYRELMREHSHVQFVEELDFRRDTLLLLGLHEFVLFLVDDCLFVGDFDLGSFAKTVGRTPDAIGVSLRLGRNATYCHSLDKQQAIPELLPASDDLLCYRWPSAECDFGYPLEVSSSLYRSSDLLPLLRELPFQNPNTLEDGMANRAALFSESHPLLLCSERSLAFCAPVNLVNQVCLNRTGNRSDMSVGTLAEKFAAGWRMDVTKFDGFVPDGCHHEVELPISQAAKATPLVSVIMPCYKQEEFLREAVASVLSQTFTDWELIIVDDGSPDNTASTAQAIIAEHPRRAISLLEKPNGGVADARNAGIRNARGAYILPLDADDIIQPTMLEQTVQLLEENAEIAIAYTDLTHFGTVDRSVQAAEFDATKISQNNQLNYCSLYRREAWELCGGYTSLIQGYEDWEFWVSCAACGLRAKRIPESLLLYRVKDVSLHTQALKRERELRARLVLNHPQLYRAERVSEARSIANTGPEPQSPGGPLVSVIVTTHNRPELLCVALRSILHQTLQDFEIIVVNDAGIDVAPWIRSLGHTERIRLQRHPYNRGVGAARNTGIRLARGKYLVYLDDDDLFYPDHLSVLVDAAERSGHAFVYSDAHQASYQQREGREFIERKVFYSSDFEFRDLLVGNQMPVLCVLHRRSCIDRVGEFDETLSTHEDWDMWIRILHHNSCTHVRQTTCEYRAQQDHESMTNSRRPDFYRTMKIIHQRYKSWASILPGTQAAQKKHLRWLAWELYESGRPVEPWGRIRFTVKSLISEIKKESPRNMLALKANKKTLIILPCLDRTSASDAILSILKNAESAKDVILLTQSSSEAIQGLKLKCWKSHSDLSIQEIKEISERYARSKSAVIEVAVIMGSENGHIAELLWNHSIPVIQFVDETPQTQESIRVFNKYSRYMGAILFSSSDVKTATHEKCPDSKAVASYLCSPDDHMQLSGLLKKIGGELGERMKVETQDRKQIFGSDALDMNYAYPALRHQKKRAAAEFTNAWRTGIGLTRPRAGFHPGIYAEECHVEGENPFAHYLRAGEPVGPWSMPVIKPPFFFARRRTKLKAALQIHLFYPEMSAELIQRIKRSISRPDLFISVPSEEALQETRRHFKKFTDRRVEIRMVPNRGRDIGPFLTEFAAELQSYQAIGHVHTKRSLHLGDRGFVEQWRNLLMENMIGGKKPMMDVILKEMESDPKLGLVFPDDPNIVGWTKNRDPAQALMRRMGLQMELPKRSLSFPVGTMFWARTEALQPLFDLKLDWSDYPEEPTPEDGTILHAIERLLPFVATGRGYNSAVTYVRGFSR